MLKSELPSSPPEFRANVIKQNVSMIADHFSA